MTGRKRDVDLARRVREACIETFLKAYEDAGIQGLCGEGRLEVAVDAVRQMDLWALSGETVDPEDEPERERDYGKPSARRPSRPD